MQQPLEAAEYAQGRLDPLAEKTVVEKAPRVSCLIGEQIWQDRWGR